MRPSPSATLIGIVAGLVALAVAGYMEGSPPTAFFNVPAALIVLGGTAAATLAGTSLERVKQIPELYGIAFRGARPDMHQRVDEIVELADQARREGLLALDQKLDQVEDPFTRKGLQLVVDGADPETVKTVLENDIDGMAARHKAAVTPFDKAGGFAPTMGIIGTVMALVQVLKDLSDPASIGPAISVAFIATLYGVGMANVVLFPVANRLKELSAQEVDYFAMTLEGVLAIQSGDNPRVVADKLQSFLPPSERPAPQQPTGFADDGFGAGDFADELAA